jgi:hypothetical protein
MRILLADDHGLFVEGLTNLLSAGGYMVGFESLDPSQRRLHSIVAALPQTGEERAFLVLGVQPAYQAVRKIELEQLTR